MRTRILLLVLAAAILAPAADWTKRFPLTGKPELRVDTNDASIEVRTGGAGAIEVRVIAEGWTIGSDEVRVTDHQFAIASNWTSEPRAGTGASAITRLGWRCWYRARRRRRSTPATAGSRWRA